MYIQRTDGVTVQIYIRRFHGVTSLANNCNKSVLRGERNFNMFKIILELLRIK